MASGQYKTDMQPENAKPVSRRAVLSSRDIFRGKREVIIEHLDQYYRLQITKAGKLILNK